MSAGLLDLLGEARRLGLDLARAGDRLLIAAPRSAEPLARRLLARKREVFPLLDAYNGHAGLSWDGWQRYVPLHPLQPSHDDEFAGQACSGPVADDENESATAASSSDLAAPCSGPVADDETAIRYRADQRKHPDVTAVADVAAANVEGEAAWQPPTDADAPPLDAGRRRLVAAPVLLAGIGACRLCRAADEAEATGRGRAGRRRG